MAYLVIVHVPYTEVTESSKQQGDEQTTEKESTKKNDTNRDLDSGDAERLITDDKEADNEACEEGTRQSGDGTVVDMENKSEDKTVEETPAKENDPASEDNAHDVGTEMVEVQESGDGEVQPVSEENNKIEDDDPEYAEENSDDDIMENEEPLTPLFQKIPIHVRVERVLTKLDVDSVGMEVVGHGLYVKFSFVQEDSQKCEQILNRLRGIGVGLTAGSSMSVFPSSLHESGKVEPDIGSQDEDSQGKTDKSDEVDQKKSQFRKSVKSRLLVAQVVKSVTANALFTFDYLLLLVLASLIACIGLAENSSVVLVASMLISPLMGPILAATFGQVIRKKDLRDLGLRSELKGLVLCLVVGFLFGLISGGVGLHGAVWGSSDSWPTVEMKSRGMLRSLWVGVLIALPSGAGVAISVLGGNAGSLVGVAISASLLPPACNAGMLWAYSFLAAISPPGVKDVARDTIDSLTTTPPTTTQPSFNMSGLPNTTISTNTTLSTLSINMTTLIPPPDTVETCLPLINNEYTAVYFCNVAHEAAILGLISLLLTLLNICCIIIMGILVLKIKEVAPKSAGVDTFWREDVQVARGYYMTAKGESSKSLGRTFLEEYKKMQAQERDEQKGDAYPKTPEEKGVETCEDLSLDSDMATIEVHEMLQNVENSPDCQAVLNKLTNLSLKKVAEEIDNEYNEAAEHIASKLAKKPGVYLANHSVRDKEAQQVYNTIHHLPSNHRPDIVELRDAFKKRKAPSMFIESTAFSNCDTDSGSQRGSRSPFGLSDPTSRLFRRRKQKVKFHVTKVEEEQELV